MKDKRKSDGWLTEDYLWTDKAGKARQRWRQWPRIHHWNHQCRHPAAVAPVVVVVVVAVGWPRLAGGRGGDGCHHVCRPPRPCPGGGDQPNMKIFIKNIC